MAEHKPMTYREIKAYAESEGWDFTAGGHGARQGQAGLVPDDPESMPWGVFQWLTHEVLPTIQKTDHYDFPSALDLICPHTNPLKTGRYATEPIE